MAESGGGDERRVSGAGGAAVGCEGTLRDGRREDDEVPVGFRDLSWGSSERFGLGAERARSP